MRLRVLAVVPVALLVGGTAVATADPAPPRVAPFQVVGNGPHDLMTFIGSDFAPGDEATLALVSDAGQTIVLPSITVDAGGYVINPSSYRTPDALPLGTYHLTITDQSGHSGAGPAFTVAAPAAHVPNAALPGDDIEVLLTGAGGGSDVVRTFTVDGVATSFQSFEYIRGVADNLGRMGLRFALPMSTPAGSVHDLVITQERYPAFTVSTTLTAAVPSVDVSSPGPDGFGNRQTITVIGRDFGPHAPLTGRVTDATGHTFDLEQISPSASSSSVTLPGLAPGTADLVVTNGANGAVAHAELPIATATTTAPNGLAPGGVLLSPDGNTRLMLGADGNLVVARQYLPKWSSATTGRDGANLVPLPDGSWGLKTRAGAVVWSTRSPTTDRPTRLTAQADGNVVLYSAHGRALWSTRTAGGDLVTLAAGSYLGPNGRLRAGIGDYTAIMQTDGTFLIVRGSDAAVTFRTPTGHNPGAAITLQPDGNLVVYSAAGKALWANGVRSGPGARLVMQLDGNVVEYSLAGKALWATNTARR